MNSKITTNSQLLTTKPKKITKTNQTTRTGTELQKHGGLSVGKGRREWGKGTGNKQHKWQVENRQGEVKNSMGNVDNKEFICTTHGHELRGGDVSGGMCRVEGNERGEMGQL